MGSTRDEKIARLKEAIDQKREELGITGTGKIPTRILVELLKKNPPIDDIVQYTKTKLRENPPRYRYGTRKPKR